MRWYARYHCLAVSYLVVRQVPLLCCILVAYEQFASIKEMQTHFHSCRHHWQPHTSPHTGTCGLNVDSMALNTPYLKKQTFCVEKLTTF